MKSNYLLTAFLITLFVSVNQKSHAQTPGWLWAKSMGSSGNDICEAIAVDDSGNVYAVGSYEGTVDFDPGPGIFNLTALGILDAFVLKLDSNGNFIWAVSLGGTGTDKAYSIKTDHSGNAFITGRFGNTVDFDPGAGVLNLSSNGDMDVFILKLTSTGSLGWAKSVGSTGDDQGFGLALDGLNNVIVTGYFQNMVDFDPGAGTFNQSAKGGYDAFIMKLEGSGIFLWAVTYGSLLSDDGKSVATDTAGNIYATGYFINTVDFNPGAGVDTLASNGYMDIYILKLDPLGKYKWAKNMGGNQTDNGWDIFTDVGGNVYSTGTFLGTADFDPGSGTSNLTAVNNSDVFVSKLDSNGLFSWADAVGGNQADYGYSIMADASGNIYIAGIFRQTVDFDPGTGVFNLSAVDNDGYILKVDTSGNFIWALKIGGVQGQYSDQATSMAFDKNNHLFVGGNFMSLKIAFGNDTLTNNNPIPGQTADIYIAKLDSGVSTAGIQNNSMASAISVYPNPAKDLLLISFPLLMDKEVEVIVSDISGKQYFKTNTNTQSRLEINTNELSGGIYLVKIQSDKFTEIRKVVVIK